MSSGAGSFIKVVAKNFDVLAGPIVGLAYPLYASIRAIETTKSPREDRQWLTYWILYSMIALFELTFAKFIEWIPFWSLAKLIITGWLVYPQYSGASYIYENYVRPFYVSPPNFNTWYPRKHIIVRGPDDILSAAEKYIQEHGTEAFEKLIKKADKKSVPVVLRSSGDEVYGEDYNDVQNPPALKSSSYKFYGEDYNHQNSYYYDDCNEQKSYSYYYDDYNDQQAYYYDDYKGYY